MDTTKPKVGTSLFAEIGPERFALAKSSSMDPKAAAAVALAAYLEKVVFAPRGGKPFQFIKVRTEWPESFENMKYPSGALTAATEPRLAHSLTPTALEETLDQFCPGTVLWKTSELAVEFQLDCWLNTRPERQAVVARLDEVFNPSESRAGVLLQGPEEYYDRIVRCTFLGGDRVDNSNSVLNRDREYQARILAEVDVVHLRRAERLVLGVSLDGEAVAQRSR